MTHVSVVNSALETMRQRFINISVSVKLSNRLSCADVF